MKFQTSIFAMAAFALLTGPVPVPNASAIARGSDNADAARPAAQYAPPTRDPLCKIYASEERVYPRPMTRGTKRGGLADTPTVPYLPSPPPPPPLMPPPPIMSMPATGAVATEDSAAKMPAPQSGRYMPMPGRYLPPPPEDRERYEGEAVAGIKAVAAEPVSTFAVDVDTGAYANVRRFLNQGQMPPAAAVRTEEMVNYFRYDYPLPTDRDRPFSITTDMAVTPWNKDSRLLRIGLRGYDLDYAERPAANLVFLVDVSGSMGQADKLPLVKSALSMLADNVRSQDRVSIVVYAGAAGLKLSPCNKPDIIKSALNQLESGGSTAGGAGLQLAYATAQQNFKRGSVNRIMLATDGDFNVGISDAGELKKYVEKQREGGVTLTTLGFGQGNYNEALMEQIANVGNGNYAYIDSAMEARKVLDEEMSSTLFTIAKDVKIQIEFNPAYVREYRLIGYENRLLAEEDFDNDKIDAGDIGASHQVTALYEIMPTGMKGWLSNRRYDANKAGIPAAQNGEAAFIKLRYKLPDGVTSRLIEQPLSARMMMAATKPSGDMAFATAVAAFGQKLRGDKYLSDFGFDDIRTLAGEPRQFWRQEFIKLTEVARSTS
jgi:Ca-activated chloride channel homolog